MIARDSFQQLLPLFGADAVRLLFCKHGECTEICGSLAGIVCQCFNLQLRPSSVPARWRWLRGAGDRCRFVTAASGCAGELPARGSCTHPRARQTPNSRCPGPRTPGGIAPGGVSHPGQIGIPTKLGNAGPLIRPDRDSGQNPGHGGIPEIKKLPRPGPAGGYFPGQAGAPGTGAPMKPSGSGRLWGPKFGDESYLEESSSSTNRTEVVP